MSHLWDIVQGHLDEYGVREAALARRMGTSPQTLNSWKKRGLTTLPERRLLEALARETRTPYETVLDAVLRDTGYREDVEIDADAATTTHARGSRATDQQSSAGADRASDADRAIAELVAADGDESAVEAVIAKYGLAARRGTPAHGIGVGQGGS